MNYSGYTSLSQRADDDNSVEKEAHSDTGTSSPTRNGDEHPSNGSVHSSIFSSRYICIALIILLAINALCLFATMRQLSLAAHILKPFLDGRAPFFDARDLPRPDQYDGL